MARRAPGCIVLLATVCALPAGAHHSDADYDTKTSFTLTGTLMDVQWNNPHILLFVAADAYTYRIEWITLTGAAVTGVSREQFTPGEPIVVVGSHHRDPDTAVIARIQQIYLPADSWQWQVPAGGGRSP